MNEFAELVEQHLQRESRSPSWLAKQLGVYPSTAGRWLNEGSRPNSPELVLKIADALNINDKDERHDLLVAAGYGVRDREVFDSHVAEGPEPTERFQTHENVFGEVLFAQLNELIGLDDAPAHWRVSHAGIALYTLRQLGNYFTPRWIMATTVGLLVWVIAIQLVGPIHQWSLDELYGRWMSCLKFGLGGFLIPVLVATITTPDGWHDIDLKQRHIWLKGFVLKVTGALVGFYVFSMVAFVVSLGWFYIFKNSLPSVVISLLVLIPLVASYIGAKRIPFDRIRYDGDTLPILPTDRLILLACTLAVPATSVFIYINHIYLTHNFLGPLVILTAIGIVAWVTHKKRGSASSTDF